MQRYSRQREAVLENLRARYDHPTADMIYTDLKKSFPNLSLGTVYRNLAVLCEAGTILKILSLVIAFAYFVLLIAGKWIFEPGDAFYVGINIFDKPT